MLAVIFQCFMNKILLVIVVLLFVSCTSCNKRYDKLKWLRTDPGFPPDERKTMLYDLITNYKLTGINYTDLISLLGNPDFIDTSKSLVTYEIELHYDMIDPDYAKDLNFNIGRDSIVRSYNITEWKK